ncbi:Type 1 glutamine amidotransferase-like domain-containing protein [Kitasatospora sp. NPDC048194]|uniref:Type 1 glutamine amidotransferase-like domain-containing protein n=1 Tax=Kitasatospora sp. NPDC048194 TaxID=3364045 RepID=UPI003714012C
MTGRVFLAGGGGAEDSVGIDRAFAARVAGSAVLYVPLAKDLSARDYEAGRDWLRSALEPLGIARIGMWSAGPAPDLAALRGYGGVYLSGGDTARLLTVLRTTGALDVLRAYVAAGGALYGGSAGAAVLGRDIGTTAHLDRGVASASDTRGSDLLGGWSVWPHYRPEEADAAAAWARDHDGGVIALGERGGLVIGPDGVRSSGADAAWLVESGRPPRRLAAGERLSAPLAPALTL